MLYLWGFVTGFCLFCGCGLVVLGCFVCLVGGVLSWVGVV